jgi:Ca-activated chloride channel family protein
MQMLLRTDRHLLRATARSTRYLLVSLSAPTAPPREGRLPVHAAIVLDRSGSMSGESKFDLAREAVEQALRMLRPTDRFTLVVYDSIVDVLMPSVFATDDTKRTALGRLGEIQPRGSTNLHAGWTTAAAQMLPHALPNNANECVNRMLLLTDGLANEGTTDSATLIQVAAQLRADGVATSTFGVGEDFDEQLLRDIALEGDGQSYYIETPDQISDLLTSELGEALEVVRPSAVMQVTLPPGAVGEPLNRHRFTRVLGDNELHIQLGDLTSGQELSVVVRLTFPEDREGAVTRARVGISSASALSHEIDGALSWTYADHDANDAQPRDVGVDREVAALYAGRARADATQANRRGDFHAARRALESTAGRIRGYANGDPILESLWRALMAEVEHYSLHRLSEKQHKVAYFAAEGQVRNRDGQGKARRGPR